MAHTLNSKPRGNNSPASLHSVVDRHPTPTTNVSRTPWLPALILVVLVLAAHGNVLTGWWRYEDHEQLALVAHSTWWKLVSDPATYRSFNAMFFTPWLPLQYKIDLALFGLLPAAHYAHALGSLMAVVLLSYALLARQVDWRWAFIGAAGFAMSTPAYAILSCLPARHYVDGLAFMIGALLCHLHWTDTQRTRHLTAASLLYFMSMLCKEVFAPLPAVLLLLAATGWRARARALVFYSIGAMSYLGLRWHFLGSPIGGYRNELNVEHLLSAVRTLLTPLAADKWAIELAAVLAFLAALLLLSWRRPVLLLHAAVIAVVLALPFVGLGIAIADSWGPDWFPELPFREYRLVLLATWTFFIGGGWLAGRLWAGAGAVGVAAALFFAVLTFAALGHSTPKAREAIDLQARHLDAETRFMERGPADEALFVTSAWILPALVFRSEFGLVEGAHPVASLHDLIDKSKRVEDLFAWDMACACLHRLREHSKGAELAANLRDPGNAPIALLARGEIRQGAFGAELLLPDSKMRIVARGVAPFDGAPDFLLPRHTRVSAHLAREIAWARVGRSDPTLGTAWTPRWPLDWQRDQDFEWHQGVFVVPQRAEEFLGAATTTAEGCALDVPQGNATLGRRSVLAIDGSVVAGRLMTGTAPEPSSIAVGMMADGQLRYVARMVVVGRPKADGLGDPTAQSVRFKMVDARFDLVATGRYELIALARVGAAVESCHLQRTIEVTAQLS